MMHFFYVFALFRIKGDYIRGYISQNKSMKNETKILNLFLRYLIGVCNSHHPLISEKSCIFDR